MNDEKFFKGLVAALATSGVEFIDTRGDRHQVAVRRAIDLLRDLQESGTAGATSMPRALLPRPVTGAYEEFDDALLRLQDLGYDSAQNPYYPGVALTPIRHRAERILSRFSKEEQEVFAGLAQAFNSGSGVPTVQTA